MKLCPTCSLVETDDALRFCRADGTTLINYSGPIGAEAGTARFNSAPISGETETSILPHTSTTPEIRRSTGPTTALPLPQTQNTTRELTKPKRRGVVLAMVGLAVIVITAAGYLFWSRDHKTAIESIAVMPFVNESGDADVEYLSDGMTETLISSLSQLPNLNVKPRSSVFRYKGKETNTQAIGKELNVQAILNGRVVQHGQDLSLFVELIDVALDKVVWSQHYERKQNDILMLQSEIARDLSNRLKTKLSGADEARVTKTYTANPEAYQLYLKGNFYLSKFTEEGYKKAIEYYQKAIDIDPNYALPYQGIAAAYDFANDFYLSPKESMPKAKAAALKAVELDDTFAEAHYELGKIAFWYDWDWTTAERETKRASELDSAYTIYPVYLSAMGRFDEAINAQEMRLRKLPLDLNMNLDMEGIYRHSGKYDKAMEQARKTLEIEPKFWDAYQTMGLVYERKKQYTEAVTALEKARSLDNNPLIAGYLGHVYAVAGKKAEAQKVIDQLKELSKQRYVSPYGIATIYAGLNDKDQAFEWLERAYDQRGSYMTLLKVDTVFDNLRPDPRFKALLNRMNLPE